MGFELDDLGNNSYAINGLPAGVENQSPVTLVKDIVNKAIETGCEIREETREVLALALAKTAAIPYGKALSNEEMDHLVASLFSSSSSNHTPDGKTIITILAEEELEKRFK